LEEERDLLLRRSSQVSNFAFITIKKKVEREPISQTSAKVRVSNQKFRLQLKKLKLEN
jgi:hypothetical protein